MWKTAFNKFEGYGLLQADSASNKFYLVHSRILCPILLLTLAWLMHPCTLQQMRIQHVSKLSIFDICDDFSCGKIISNFVESSFKICYIWKWTQSVYCRTIFINNKYSTTRREICLKLTKKRLQNDAWRRT